MAVSDVPFHAGARPVVKPKRERTDPVALALAGVDVQVKAEFAEGIRAQIRGRGALAKFGAPVLV